MEFILENHAVKAAFKPEGAELTSLVNKENELEYLWQGNPEFWGRQAPVLFPIVGRLKEDRYLYQGKEYALTQHGFARDKVFEIIEQTDTRIIFELQSDEETKKVYPFDFSLQLIYDLLPNGVQVGYRVENKGEEPLFFAIGGHPAFNVPLNPKLTFEDYYLHFSPQKSRLKLPLAGPYIDYANRTLGQTNTDIQLRRELFKDDALVYETKGLNSYTIRSEQSDESVTLSYEDMDYVGIWSPYAKEAPFVCIEPWKGVADVIDASGNLEEKFAIQKLNPLEVSNCQYVITIK